MYWNKQQ